MSEAIASPCVNICVLDRESGLCIGCLRTGAEIGAWLGMDPAERTAVIAELPARAGRLGPAAMARARAAARRRAYRNKPKPAKHGRNAILSVH